MNPKKEPLWSLWVYSRSYIEIYIILEAIEDLRVNRKKPRSTNPRFEKGLINPKAFTYTVTPLPRGSIVVPFWGSCIESYKVIPKRNH